MLKRQAKYCMYCGRELTKDDRLDGCCNDCAEY
jgi:hypothetical protein